MYKLVLCLRYLRTRYIMFITIGCIMLGVTALIVTNSVMSGFSHEMQDRIHGVLSDVTFEGRSANGFPDAEAHIAKIQELCGDKIEAMTPICQSIGLLSFQIRGNWFSQQVCVIGIDPEGENETKDFGKFFQHPDNRKQLSFNLRERGYEQSPEGSPIREALQFAGWEYRRMMPPPLDIVRQPIDNDPLPTNVPDPSSENQTGQPGQTTADQYGQPGQPGQANQPGPAGQNSSDSAADSDLVPLPPLPDDPHADTPVQPDVSSNSPIFGYTIVHSVTPTNDAFAQNSACRQIHQVFYPPQSGNSNVRQPQRVRISGAIGQSGNTAQDTGSALPTSSDGTAVPPAGTGANPDSGTNPVYNNVFNDPAPGGSNSGAATPYNQNAPLPPQLDYPNTEASVPALNSAPSAENSLSTAPPRPAAPVVLSEANSDSNPDANPGMNQGMNPAPSMATPESGPSTAANSQLHADFNAASVSQNPQASNTVSAANAQTDAAGSAIQDPFAAYRPQQVRIFDPRKEQHAGIILGISLTCARKDGEERFFLKPGCDVKLTMATSATPPTSITDNFTIVDLYESKMSEFDSSFVFVPLSQMQHLRGMFDPSSNKGMINTIRIKLKDPNDAREVRDILRDHFETLYPGSYIIETWQDKRNNLLSAVEIEKAVMNILLYLIIFVTGFQIYGLFFMIVTEKTRDIGILKALGASSTGIMSIFISYGIFLGIVGSGLGFIVGLLFSLNINTIADWMAQINGRPLFDPDIYYFYKIPVYIDPSTMFWIVFSTIITVILASIFPAWRAASKQPVEALQ